MSAIVPAPRTLMMVIIMSFNTVKECQRSPRNARDDKSAFFSWFALVTEVQRQNVIGNMTRELVHRVKTLFALRTPWNYDARATFGNARRIVHDCIEIVFH